MALSLFIIQFVTNYMFKQLVKRKFPAAVSVCQDTIETCLSYQEENSLRYAAGYIPRNLIKKIKRSSLDNKEVLQLCLLDLIEEDGMGDDESQEWIQAVNRGGLNNVTQSMLVHESNGAGCQRLFEEGRQAQKHQERADEHDYSK